MSPLDRDQIIGLLEALSEELERRGARAEDLPRRRRGDGARVRRPTRNSRPGRGGPTQDEVYAAAAAVASEHGLPDDWLNDAVKGFLPGDDPQARPVFETDSLRVDVASPQYLLAMKLLAARETDIDDIMFLYRLCGFTTAAEGLNLLESVYPGRTVAPKVQYLLEEIVSGTADS